MAGISIPGVTNKYKTNETVEKLMQIERIPLTREQKTLETYKLQQDAMRNINKKITSLRDSIKSLYSFDNPFNNKQTSSSDENAVTANAARNASYDNFKIDVIKPASSDKFLSSEIDKDIKVPSGVYTYKIADKVIKMRWKGGSLQNFSDSLNKRGNNILKTRVVNTSKGKKTFSIESLKTGKENKLIFEDEAKIFAEKSGMIISTKDFSEDFASSLNDFLSNPPHIENKDDESLPEITSNNLEISSGSIIIPPRNGFTLNLPDTVKNTPENCISFLINNFASKYENSQSSNKLPDPVLPDSGSAGYKDVRIFNAPVEISLFEDNDETNFKTKSINKGICFAVMADGSKKEIHFPELSGKEEKININLSEYQGISSLVLRNKSMDRAISISNIAVNNDVSDFLPKHPISIADDATIKYEGITITRSENTIDDVIPEVTLNIHDKTEKSATISIFPDTESAKDALITFVGKYNQALSEINILLQNKQELIDELDYFSKEEKDDAKSRLGLFSGDSSLLNLKTNIQSTTSANYSFSDSAEITMLAQLGIATNASGYSGYAQSKLRGYLEIDEKKLDEQLDKYLDDVKKLFGYDSDGDLIIDSGIAFRLDKQLTAYVQSGGIFAVKTSSIDNRIKSTEQKIAKLETQMDKKEAELRMKYGQMEGALNELESQQSTISNFSNQNRNDR